jgi:tripartite-type tricarboxylate transporter receptor subunit TctC
MESFMEFFRGRFLCLTVGMTAALAGIFLSQVASSQEARTIKVIVAVASGGPGENMTRLFADSMRQAFSQAHRPTIVFEPSIVGDGTFGAESVSQAEPDGNTLLMTTNAFFINPYLRAVRYDPLTSFEPVCYLVSSPEVVIVASTLPYRTLAELLNAARAKPGELTMASFGPAGSSHIAVERLKFAASVDMHYVPFPTQFSAVNAVLGGDVTSAITSYKGADGRLKAGALRALATASRNRIQPLPDVPTIAESGCKDYESEVRLLLFAPAKTPKETVTKLAGWFGAAMQVPEIKSKLVAQELYPVGMCGADFASFTRQRYSEIGQIIRAANIK